MYKQPVEASLKEALAAIRQARDVRAFHRRRTRRGTDQRETDIQEARDRLRRAMLPLRSYLGAVPYRNQSLPQQELTQRVRIASKQIQSERRRLWKMQARQERSSRRV